MEDQYILPNNRCIFKTPVSKSAIIADYFESRHWHAQNYGDYLLYATANKSLDRTIKHLGEKLFKSALDNFLVMKSYVLKKCSSKTIMLC